MTQTTDNDIKDLKNLIIVMREEMRAGFTKVDADIRVLDQRVSNLEKNLDEFKKSNEKSIDELKRSTEKSIDELKKSNEKSIDELKTSTEKSIDELKKSIDKQDTRLWAFGALVFGAALTVLVKIFAFPNV